ncbi:MAG TPA: response regulator transcription factor, partial [Azospirillaceae bacterium]|nr:response regulator transcription factor [Azospirillaceae bacterium]
GADIYMTKPVDLRELVAAAHSLIRRLGSGSPPAMLQPAGMAAGDGSPWRFDPAGFALCAPNGRSVPLTTKEMALVTQLTAHPGGVVSRGELLGAIGYDPSDPTNRNLDAALRRLRLKVEDRAGVALPLRTVQGVGYQLEADVHIASAAA